MSKATGNIWTEEKLAEVISEYQAALSDLDPDEQQKQSIDIVKRIAEEQGTSVNALRGKLVTAGVYVKKGPATASSSSTAAKTGGARTSKDSAHAELKAAFTDAGIDESEIDADIIAKLTGKGATHLAELVRKITK